MNADQVDLRQLRALVALAEEGTFTDAAIRLGTSQPVVSRAIARLEELVGVRLVERTTRTVALTAAGQALAAAAERSIQELDHALATVGAGTRPLRLGFAWAAFGRHTTAILRSWRIDHPDLPIEVHRVDERYAGLTRGLIDIAIVRGDVDTGGPFASRELLTERRLAALPSGHPLAGRGDVVLAELTETMAITPSIGTTTLDLWPGPQRPRDTVTVDNIDEWLSVISSGAAIGVTPESTAVLHAHPGIAYVPIADAPAVVVNLVWPREHPHGAVREFAEHVQRCIEAPE
jgi:DNA-binding transcriptional LysR family regulator